MLVNALNDEALVTTQLLELLRQEYTVLKTRNVAELEKLTGEKQTCMERLQQLTERVSSHLRQQGFGTDAAGMEAYIASHEPPARELLQTSWETLRDMATQARRQNEVNGAIINAGRSHVEQALSILRGPDTQNYVYDQGAQTSSRSKSHSLATA